MQPSSLQLGDGWEKQCNHELQRFSQPRLLLRHRIVEYSCSFLFQAAACCWLPVLRIAGNVHEGRPAKLCAALRPANAKTTAVERIYIVAVEVKVQIYVLVAVDLTIDIYTAGERWEPEKNMHLRLKTE